jgi:hypothetical protein
MSDAGTILPPPAPPTLIWPARTRPELLVDQDGVFVVDPTTLSFVGFDQTWGPGAPLQRMLYAVRVEGTRPL